MNILFISTLYPGKENHSIKEISYALHNFVKVWAKSEHVEVFRPFFPNWHALFGFKSPYCSMRGYPASLCLDGVSIFNKRVFCFPFVHKFMLINLKGFKPDIIVGHMSSSYTLAKTIAKKYNVPYVLGIHNSDLRLLHEYEKELRSASCIACRSFSIKNKFLNIYPKYKNRIFVANSGIELSVIENHVFFAEKAVVICNTKEPVFVTASLLQKLKNIDINLYALSRFKNFAWKYYILGDGEEMEHLVNLAKELGIQEKVFFEGMKTRNEVVDFLKQTHFFIMVSAPETFGLAYLEAMSKGNIVIGCKNWGIAGVVEDKKNGYLVEERNVDELSNVLFDIFHKKNSTEEMLYETEKTINEYTEEIRGGGYLQMLYQIK